ncbi:hypothetical protein BKI52_03460 [marine bacterium AO1-C]|nr:hypothetical protein BKI52_03460 [marine bacterium AO1-C]
MSKVSEIDDLYLMDEDIPTCVLCSANTKILKELISETVLQVHQCLDARCEQMFSLIEDFE